LLLKSGLVRAPTAEADRDVRARLRRVYLAAPVAGTSIGGLAYQFVRGEQPRPGQSTT
jgi:hypothetical protein